MRITAAILIITLLSLSAAANIRDIPASVLSDENVKIVLSQEERKIYPYRPTWALMPEMTIKGLFADDNKSKYDRYYRDISVYDVSLDDTNGNILSVLMDLAAPLSDKYIKDDDYGDSDRELFSPYLYVDVSAVVLSYIVRQLSNDKFDLLLLTPDLDENNSSLMKGVEFGLRLTPTYGVRLRVLDSDNNTAGYGMEFQLYPSDNTTIKFTHDDNDTDKSTGVEFKLEF